MTELKDEDGDEAQQLPPSNHDNGQFVTPDQDPKLLKHLSVLYEDLEEGDDTSFPINSHRVGTVIFVTTF